MRLDFKNNPKLGKLVTIILIGLLLLVVALPVKSTDTLREGNATGGENQTTQTISYDSSYYEAKLKEILEKSYGAGTMSVMVNLTVTKKTNSFYGDSGEESKVDGVLVVADVNDAKAVSDITYAVCALFDLPAHKVAVILKE